MGDGNADLEQFLLECGDLLADDALVRLELALAGPTQAHTARRTCHPPHTATKISLPLSEQRDASIESQVIECIEEGMRTSGGLSLQVGPEPRQARQAVHVQRQLHLHTTTSIHGIPQLQPPHSCIEK